MKFLLIVLVTFVVTAARSRHVFHLDERWVCNIKKSCFDCLRLPHCSWCEAETKCFSKKLPTFEDYCKDNGTELMDHGLSFEENAHCACAGDDVERHCYPPGVAEGLECSGRGNCVCGRCVCDPNPSPEHPTKMIVGEYCEFDNYSCDGPKCNEGPYSLTGQNEEEDTLNDK